MSGRSGKCPDKLMIFGTNLAAAKRRVDRGFVTYFDSGFKRDGKEKILLSGRGCWREEYGGISEAEQMANYAMATYGVPANIFLLEERSTYTIENFTCSAQEFPEFFEDILAREKKLGLVSHPYHLARIALIGSRMGLPESQLTQLPTIQLDNKEAEAIAYERTKRDLDLMEQMGTLAVFSNNTLHFAGKQPLVETTRLAA